MLDDRLATTLDKLGGKIPFQIANDRAKFLCVQPESALNPSPFRAACSYRASALEFRSGVPALLPPAGIDAMALRGVMSENHRFGALAI